MALAAPVFLLIAVAKTVENSADYSLHNTVRQALFLPTSRDAKYKAKAAIEKVGKFDRKAVAQAMRSLSVKVSEHPGVLMDVTYDANGSTTGQLSGAIDGTSLAWDGRAINGMPVEGRATLTPDGHHMHVEERSPALGVLRYTAHKNHVPHW